jgi:p24 family protein delta-1
MIFMSIPSTLPSEVEEWYVNQVTLLSKDRSGEDGGAIRRRFIEQPPEDMLRTLDKFMEHNSQKSNVQLRIQNPSSPRPLRQQELSWFLPVVLNHVEKFQRKEEWKANNHHHQLLDGHYVCFDNHSESQVHVIFEIILVSDWLEQEDEEENGIIGIQKRHLTPLEEELASSLDTALSVINEMRYMERREARMRLTTESINGRIRFFSYLSVAILLSVTFLQVTYLKRYFKKKKLM